MPRSTSSGVSRSDIVEQLITVCHALYEHGYVTATDGNVSARLGNGNILTTRSVLNKGKTQSADLVEVNLNGDIVKGKAVPSTELKMHLYIYSQRPDAMAVVHAHPVYATGFAVAGKPIPNDVLPEVAVNFGGVPLARYGTPSTDSLALSLAPFIHTHSAILLQNHGVVTFGRTLEDAYFKMEKVEHAAHILTVAESLGGPVRLPQGEVERLRAVYKKK